MPRSRGSRDWRPTSRPHLPDAGQLPVEQAEVDVARAHARSAGARAVAEAEEHVLPPTWTGRPSPRRAQRVLQVARNSPRTPPATPPRGRASWSLRTIGNARSPSVTDDGLACRSDQGSLERFYRAEGGQASGSGLGLAIASELADRMGGSIELASRPGETVFTLLLPRADRVFTSKRSAGEA